MGCWSLHSSPLRVPPCLVGHGTVGPGALLLLPPTCCSIDCSLQLIKSLLGHALGVHGQHALTTGLELSLPQLGQNLCDVLDVVLFSLGINKDVIQVYQHVVIQRCVENVVR